MFRFREYEWQCYLFAAGVKLPREMGGHVGKQAQRGGACRGSTAARDS